MTWPQAQYTWCLTYVLIQASGEQKLWGFFATWIIIEKILLKHNLYGQGGQKRRPRKNNLRPKENVKGPKWGIWDSERGIWGIYKKGKLSLSSLLSPFLLPSQFLVTFFQALHFLGTLFPRFQQFDNLISIETIRWWYQPLIISFWCKCCWSHSQTRAVDSLKDWALCILKHL